MKVILKNIYKLLLCISTYYYCVISGIKFDPTFKIRGRIYIIKAPFYRKGGKLQIGSNFTANSKVKSNSVGIIQPVVFNISNINSRLVIGRNVGISGSTINAQISITIGDNVLIGSGCLITDSDSHPIDYTIRRQSDKAISSPIRIEENVFIGARTIILKGVTIGRGSVIGAGSVVTKDIPPSVIAAGNPARVIKSIEKA